jgi:hypothetical protein
MPASTGTYVYEYNVGIEAEAAGRAPTKNFMTLRADLAALPWVLAGENDIVLAQKQRPEFIASLHAAGVTGLAEFHTAVPQGRAVTGHRPWGVVGPHLRRSTVTRYRTDVTVCHSLAEAQKAMMMPTPSIGAGDAKNSSSSSSSSHSSHTKKFVLKAEYSSSGLGVRVCQGGEAPLAQGSADERWASGVLRRDGTLTVEPFFDDIVGEFTCEWLDGQFCGVTRQSAPNMRWDRTLLDEPSVEACGGELYEFVYNQRGIEKTLAALEDVPSTCGAATCGIDIAVVRNASSGRLEAKVLEVNGRTTMTHYALAAKRRVPDAISFGVVRVSELVGRTDLVPLTDPTVATSFCAVVQVGKVTAAAAAATAACDDDNAARQRLPPQSCAVVASSALSKCIAAAGSEVHGSSGGLTVAEASGLLSTVWLSSFASTATAHETDASALRAVKLTSLRLLRAEAARLEKDHAAAIALGTAGVRIAVQAVSDARDQLLTSMAAEGGGGNGGSGKACAQEMAACTHDTARMGAEAAAALADLAAAAGENKLAACRLGGVGVLVGCIEQHVARVERVVRAAPAAAPAAAQAPGAGDENAAKELDRLTSRLCLQACRALGNLCYGWDVEPVKVSAGPRAVDAILGAMRAQLAIRSVPPSCATLFRWQSHALRNLAVRSVAMQDAIGEGGGVQALVEGLQEYQDAPRAQEAGMKALAYVLKDHAQNTKAAVEAGALELSGMALAKHATDAAASEAALSLLSLTVASASAPEQRASMAAKARRAARTVRSGAHLTAISTVRALLAAEDPNSAADDATGLHVAPASADDDGGGEQLGRPSSQSALLRSLVWMLAAVLRDLLTAVPSASTQIEARGVRELFQTTAAVTAQKRRKVREEVEGCLAQLDGALSLVTNGAVEDATEEEEEVKKEEVKEEEVKEKAVVVSASEAVAGASINADEAHPPPASEASPFSDEDLARCTAMLAAFSTDASQFEGSRFRNLRKALGKVHQALGQRDAAALEYGRRRQLKMEEEGRKKSKADLDRRHVDTTGLRKGRIDRLKRLCEEGGGGSNGTLLAIGMEGGADSNGGGDGQGSYYNQVPDGAARDKPVRALLGQKVDDDESASGGTSSCLLAPPGTAGGGGGAPPPLAELHKARQCYTCKSRFHELHHFYAQLCPKCASLNYRMRHATADLRGRVALLTGARVKIGFEIGLKLLRAGATLIATSRFPADAAARYANEADFGEWKERLQLHAVDLRDVAALEGFCDFLCATLPRLDIVVNNACQTVRRPASYYAHLLGAEAEMEAAVAASAPQHLALT